jgi:hypothetical protein
VTDPTPEGAHEEQELRALLERAVPQLPAPAQRLESVRERVRRRRRRRAAGLSATAVLAVAAAGLLLPGVTDPGGSPLPDATGTLAPTVTLAPTGTGTASGTASDPAAGSAPPTAGPTTPGEATSAPTAVPRAFPALSGLRVAVPAKWSVLVAQGGTRAYVSSQDLALPEAGCAKQRDDFCTPLVRMLDTDGVLVQFTLSLSQGMADKARGPGRAGVTGESVFGACRAVGGTEQLGALLADGSGSPAVVVATACLADPTPEQETRARELIAGADFS